MVKKYAVNFEGRRLQVCFLEMSPHAVTCSARAFVRSLLTFFADFFLSRLLQAIEGSDFVEGEDGKRVYDLTKVLSAATAALHTRDEAKLTEVREQCAAIARDNGAPVKTEEDAQAWVQDVLCKAYTARTLMRKLKGWKVQ